MDITPLGDSALIVRVCNDFETNAAESLSAVLETRRRLEAAAFPGVIESAVAYTTVALFYDPVRAVAAGAPHDAIFDWFQKKIETALRSGTRKSERGREPRLIEIPVCYDREFGVDLDEVSRRVNLPVDEIVRRHSAAAYCVNCVGFTPGFPYLSGLPAELAVPRRATPRKEVPAGSVAIAGPQTGIYPQRSPGGWNVIGRTPVRLFDPQEIPPALLRAGDRVRFRAITRAEFEKEKQ